MILLHLLAYNSCASCLTSWLKGKGDDFYRARDYRAAINAYTTALEIDSTLLPAMGNRSACYLHMGELVRCVDDCDAILNRLDKESMHVNAKPKDPQTTAMRLKALARRGAAKCQQGAYADAVVDYRMVVTLTNMQDPSLIADLRRVIRLAKCSELKRQGDAHFGDGRLQQALACYREVLASEPGFVSAISNCAVCQLAMGRLEECVVDCSRALEILAVDPATVESMDSMMLEIGGTGVDGHSMNSKEKNGSFQTHPVLPAGPVPPIGSAKRRSWVLKTVARRGTAKAALGELAEAIRDYECACNMDPNDSGLKADLNSLYSRLRLDEDHVKTVHEVSYQVSIGAAEKKTQK